MPEPKTIEQLKTLNRAPSIEGTFRIANCEYKPFAQKPGVFLQAQLSDKSGEMKGVVWDGAEVLRTWLKNKMIVKVKGELTRFNDQPQIVIKTLSEQKEYNPSDFIPSLEEHVILGLVTDFALISTSIKDPDCKKIWFQVESSYFNDFKMCPGGVGQVHHNYLGGLLEHTVSMMKVAEHYCTVNPALNRDVMLTGCLLHDIGKIKSYNWKIILEMSDIGRLLHHIPLGLQILSSICNLSVGPALTYIDEDSPLVYKLKHIIVSHHEIEGCTKPMIPEALAVSLIDALDAAVNHAVNYMKDPEKKKDEGNWTAFCNLTQRPYYNPQAEPEQIPMPEVKKAPPAGDSVDLDTLLGVK